MLLLAAAAVLAGCAEESRTAPGAVVTVYAAAGACVGAGSALEDGGARAGEVTMRLRCLPAVRGRDGIDLARIGSNARRATEDSTAVAYIGEVEPAADRFAAPILATARIAHLPATPGPAAIATIRRALDEADGSRTPREAVYDAVAG